VRFNDWDGNGVIGTGDIAPEHETKYVVGAIILNERRILATQRGYGDYQGWWEFPFDFIISVYRAQMYRQMGNSVAVPMIKAVADEMKKAISREESREVYVSI
jgi:site-specific DNA-cytosine methylase